MARHTVGAFDNELRSLNEAVEEIGRRAEAQLDGALAALFGGDVAKAQEVIAADRIIDELQHTIEDKAIGTIARRQPVASDLRTVIATMRIANDLERIGDLAKNIAKRLIAISGQQAMVQMPAGLHSLATRVRAQIANVLEANRTNDDERALEVWRSDGAIDALHTALFRELLTYMMEDPRSIGFGTHLLFCAKNLERIGDHATNIAETVHYRIAAEIIAAERPKGDQSSTLTAKPDR